MSTLDANSARLAVALRRLRQARGISQSDVAKAMCLAGFPWHQQTVERVESVERPVRALEAVELAKLFDQDVAALLSADAEVTPIPSQLTSVSLAMAGLSADDLLALNSTLGRLLLERLQGRAS